MLPLAVLLLALAGFPHTWEEQGVKVTLVNPEVTPDRRYVLVHLRLQPTIDVAYFRWQSLVRVVNRAGETVPQANDCGVDHKLTLGDFPLRKGRRTEVLMYYLAQPSDFPVQIWVGDQVVGNPIK